MPARPDGQTSGNGRVHTPNGMEKLEDKLYTVRARTDSGHPHIHIDSPSACVEKCAGKYCTHFCPADVYNWDEATARIVVSWENCIECGACSIGCPYDIIRCHTPRGGFGVQNKYG